MPAAAALFDGPLPAGAVDSSALLQGQKAVSIVHNGSIYRLQATKLGKLILTK
ncbi:hemin uptake protein HemP [Acidovorax sp. YS12]|nr:hemin uptake protein HemP [Acidovorax sp. YS12]